MTKKAKIKRLKQIIDECGFMLYKENIIKSATFLPNGIEFKLPPANADWVIELFKVLSYMMLKYAVFVSGESTKRNVILLVNTCTMI